MTKRLGRRNEEKKHAPRSRLPVGGDLSSLLIKDARREQGRDLCALCAISAEDERPQAPDLLYSVFVLPPACGQSALVYVRDTPPELRLIAMYSYNVR